MDVFDTHFTIEEANALIPALRKAFAQIHQLLDRIDAADDLLVAEVEMKETGGNGKTKQPGFYDSVAAARDTLHGIARQGIVVQDWKRGLVDFPHMREGREVFLCWEIADGDKVEFFHDLNAGYAGRRPL